MISWPTGCLCSCRCLSGHCCFGSAQLARSNTQMLSKVVVRVTMATCRCVCRVRVIHNPVREVWLHLIASATLGIPVLLEIYAKLALLALSRMRMDQLFVRRAVRGLIRATKSYAICPTGTSASKGSTEFGACKCKLGHEGLDGFPCTTCGPGTFKNMTGAGECLPCPGATFSSEIASTVCCECSANAVVSPGSVQQTQSLAVVGRVGGPGAQPEATRAVSAGCPGATSA